MNDDQGIIEQIFFGVPRFCGDVFRATKIPSVLIARGILSGIFVSLLVSNVVAVINHSISPRAFLLAGYFQFRSPEIQAHAPPGMLNTIHSMTSSELALARHLVEFLLIDAGLLGFAFLWWMLSLLRFLARRVGG